MKLVIAVLAIIAIIGIASANGWLTVSNDSNQTTIQINKDEIQRDADAAAEDIKDTAEEVGDQINNLGKPMEEPVRNRGAEQPDAIETPVSRLKSRTDD